MFHRVKSETPEQDVKPAPVPAEKAIEKESAVEEKTAEMVNAKTEMTEMKDAAPETEALYKSATSAAPKSTSPLFNLNENTNTNTNEKDTQTMTEQENATQAPEAPANPYQRAASPARGAAGYPSAYPGTAGAMSAADEGAMDRRLTIGRGITMSGEIEECDYLLVEGTVEAALKGANVLEIAESGTFYGTVNINEATIAGRFEGDITVNGRLTITSTGTVTGSISYKEIEIEAGAVLDGKLTPLSSTVVAPEKKPAAAAKPAAAPKVEKQPAPANNDGELFSKATAAAE